MPKIAERNVGALEQSLGDQASTLGAALSTGLAEHLAKADADAKAAATGLVDGVQNAVNGMPTIKLPEAGTPEAIAAMKVDANPAVAATDQMKEGLDGVKKSADSAAGALKTVVAGSAEAMQMSAQAAFDLQKPITVAADSSASTPRTPATAKASAAPSVAKGHSDIATLTQVVRTILAELKGGRGGVELYEANV
jgi:hypothetical protein